MAIREGRWDCQYCGAVGIMGRHDSCGSCGRSRPAGTRFYLPSDAQVVEEEKLLARARTGPDWVCAFCDSSNPADFDTCYSCRAPRDADARDQAVVSYGLDAVPTVGDAAPVEALEAEKAPAAPAADPQRAQARRPRWLPFALVGIFLLLCGACGVTAVFLNQTEEVAVTVDQLAWSRSVEVEVFRTVIEEDWQIPAGGVQLDSRQEIRSYTQVLVGYETVSEQIPEQVQVGERTYVCGQRDLGNGFFEDVQCSEPVYETQYRTETREEPVYEQQPVFDTLYEYEIEKWVVDRTEETSGSGPNPAWPRLGADERAGERQETYTVIFRDTDGATYELTLPESEWRTYRVGDSYNAAIDRQGNIESIGN